MTGNIKRIVVFASGSGSNFEAIAEQLNHRQIGDSKYEVALLICDQPGAYCLERAERLEIPTLVVNRDDFTDKKSFEQEIVYQLNKIDLALIALAGYMRIVGPTILREYEGKIVNIHPSLLPAFPGKDGIGDALRYGVKIIGVTIHYVDAGVDTGRIIEQAAITVNPNDTEAETRQRIHAIEHELYPQVIAEILSD